MHGRLKVRTTEEQKIQKQKEQQKKLAAYRMGMKEILSTRRSDSYEPSSLRICSQLLAVNPDIYTLWNYRKEVVLMEIDKHSKQPEEFKDESEEKLIKFLEDEIALTQQCLLANPKSYGTWHHRFWVLMNHPKPNWQNEFDLCSKYLKIDDRNFHIWDYRRLIINKIGITLPEEIAFSTNLLNINFSNYSSWHYRSTLRKLDKETVQNELSLVQNAVFTDPEDSSAWFYLRWILSNPSLSKTSKQELLEAFEQLEELEPNCKWIFLAKCWLTGSLCLNDKNYLDKRFEYYTKLLKLDPLRKGQYEYYLNNAKEKCKIGDSK